MKKLLLLLIITIYAYATPFDVKISYPFNSKLFDVTQDYNGDIAITGFSTKHATRDTSNRVFYDAFNYLAATQKAEGEQMSILKLSQNGTISYDKRFGLKEFSRGITLIPSKNHSYFLGGYAQDGQLIVCKLAEKKNLKFFKKFGTQNHDTLKQLLPLYDGGVLAIGTSMTSRQNSEGIFYAGIGRNDGFLTRFSPQGRILWSKKYGTVDDDYGITAIESNDGTFMFVTLHDVNQTRKAYIMRVDEHGDVLSKKELPYDIISTSNIIKLQDKSFLVALNYYDTQRKKSALFINFDIQHKILNKVAIPAHKKSTLIHTLQESSDGSIIAVGEVHTLDNTNGFALLLHDNLTPIFAHEYGDTNYDTFKNVAILNDRSFVAVGTATPKNSEVNTMWILKINRDGTIAQKEAKTAKALYTKLCKVFHKEIQKKELSITEDLSITFRSNLLRFKIGVASLSAKQKDFIQKVAKKLFPALAPFQKSIESININGHTSTLWKTKSEDRRFLKNLQLSSQRSYNTLKTLYIYADTKDKMWLQKLLEMHALDYKEKILSKNKYEDYQKSQRVTLQIILKKAK